jgi:hypothetical protein
MMTAAEIRGDGAVVSAAAADLTSLYPAHLPLFLFLLLLLLLSLFLLSFNYLFFSSITDA